MFDYEVFSREYDATMIRHRQQAAEKWGHLQPQMAYCSSYRDRINGPIGQTNLRYGHVHILKRNTDCPSQIPSAKSVCEDHFIFNGQEERSVHQSVPVSNRENVVFKKSNIGGQYHDLTTSIKNKVADNEDMVKIEDTTANDTMADVEDTKMKIEETEAKIKPFGKGKNLSSFILLLTDGNYGQEDSPATVRNHDPIRYVMHEILHCEWLLGAHDLREKSKWMVKIFYCDRMLVVTSYMLRPIEENETDSCRPNCYNVIRSLTYNLSRFSLNL